MLLDATYTTQITSRMTHSQCSELCIQRKLKSDKFGPHFILTQSLQMTLTLRKVGMVHI